MSTQYVPSDEQLSGETPKNVDSHGKKLGLAHRLYIGDISWDFIGHRKLFFAISAAMLGIALGALVLMGLKLGIEFKGGADFSAPMAVNAQTVDTVRDAVQGTKLADLDSTQVLTVGSNEVKVQTRTLTPDEVTKVRAAIAKTAGTTNDKVTYSLIGASWGKQITAKGVQALGVFMVLVSLLIWAYFRDWKMSIAAIVALVHDLILTVGIYALVGFTVTPATLIGVLTILGYSLYDTVVVFDKVEENTSGFEHSTRRTYAEQVNLAVNQTIMRSINTTVSTLLPIFALLVIAVWALGVGNLADLAIIQFIGALQGTISSIFLAAPVLVWIKRLQKKYTDHDREVERARTGKSEEPEDLDREPEKATEPAPAERYDGPLTWRPGSN